MSKIDVTDTPREIRKAIELSLNPTAAEAFKQVLLSALRDALLTPNVLAKITVGTKTEFNIAVRLIGGWIAGTPTLRLLTQIPPQVVDDDDDEGLNWSDHDEVEFKNGSAIRLIYDPKHGLLNEEGGKGNE